MNITPIFNETGELLRFISIASDITERKNFEKALQKAKEAADSANQAKAEFLASMSHEIGTPMNAIIVMAELLSETPMTPDQRRLVHVFRSAGETLLNFINDILDLSKVEAGQIQLDSVSFDLLQLLDKTCEVMALRADEKGLELACHFASGVPANLVGDPTRIWDSLPSSPKMEKNLRPWNFPDHGMEPWPFGTRYSSKFPPLPSIQLKQ